MRWSLATIVLVPRGTTAHADHAARQRVFQWAGRVGFEGIEASPHWLDIIGLKQQNLESIGVEARSAGLVVSGVNVNRCILVRTDRADEHQELLIRAVDAAQWLSATMVTLSMSLPLCGPPRPVVRGSEFSDSEREETARRLKRLAEYSAARDIRLSLELHDDGILDTADLCLDMLGRIGMPNVGVNPDLGNLVRGDEAADWRAALAALAPHANNWHVKNYRQGQPSPIWDGQIDYAQAFAIMQAAGYDGWVGIESYFGDVLDLQSRSLDFLKQLQRKEAVSSATKGSAA